jgi:hypothetical protein
MFDLLTGPIITGWRSSLNCCQNIMHHHLIQDLPEKIATG